MEDNNITLAVTKQRAFFNTGATRSYSFRISYLKKLTTLMRSREKDILEALQTDLGKGLLESYTAEFLMVMQEARDIISHAAKWSRSQRRSGNLFCFPSRIDIQRDPHGTVLIMSPWNYPFNLTMTPVLAALAAGNTVVVKPSNYSSATSRIMQELLEAVYPPEYVTVVQGGHEANTALLNNHFDYIFFTGSPTVGKIVMQKASEYLTPITLELGGKSPCIVDDSADIAVAAQRIVWGKLLNSGQTCIAPDYLFVQDTIKDKLVAAIKAEIEKRYPMPLQNPEFPHIISKRHFDRIVTLLENAKKSHSVYGGSYDANTLKVEPTIVDNISWNDPLMQEELFCPIFPVVTWHESHEVFDQLLSLPRPLALYLFTRNTKFRKEIISRIPFGGGCINNTVMQVASHNAPFGGTGNSGMGNYHGKYSFMTFTREKTVLRTPASFEIPLRFAPFTEKKYRLVRRLFK